MQNLQVLHLGPSCWRGHIETILSLWRYPHSSRCRLSSIWQSCSEEDNDDSWRRRRIHEFDRDQWSWPLHCVCGAECCCPPGRLEETQSGDFHCPARQLYRILDVVPSCYKHGLVCRDSHPTKFVSIDDFITDKSSTLALGNIGTCLYSIGSVFVKIWAELLNLTTYSSS